ncbi:hypothetical protein G3N55_04850 [Dissulfurirhabdus thermomarina]|uniref:Glycosyltransferase RgtA/B/C/D-like domain-containing protein n=1 Tax=Dissulfurirhabdus thermomarina TaxID=1765737 RepID=A0A6N9TR08_DISTH|nr:STT3 domain-containing protein [Dissulfurirhabdus thermomarina]NDY42174.1 hypothetical protein [Dissulfurirhabdus thermomarina]
MTARKAKRRVRAEATPAAPVGGGGGAGGLGLARLAEALVGLAGRHRRWCEALALVFALAVGFAVRIEDYWDWQAQPERALYKGEALLTTFDGYYYLSLTRDLLEGTYAPMNEKRAVPDLVPRPMPPPMLPVVAAGVVKLTGASLNWTGAVLPAVLGLFLAFPLYGLGRYYGGPVMGWTAALVGLLSNYYVYRSSLGWFDTDCLNVTWATAVVYFFLRFGVERGRRRYGYFAGGLAVFAAFLWWWDGTPQVVAAICLVPLVTALAFFYRPERREGLVFAGCLAALAALALAVFGIDLPARIYHAVSAQYHYIAKDTGGAFPNIGVTISEQARPTFMEVVFKTTGSLPAFLLSLAGLGWLFWRRPEESLFLSVPVLLGGLSFLFAKRFLIFLAPVNALGLGYLVYAIWWLRRRWPLTALAAPVLVLFLSYPAFMKGWEKDFWPKEPPHLIAGMEAAGEKTPPRALIWAWWDHGYPMIYWSRRGTMNDGMVHSGERSVYNGLPMATDDPRLSANFMRFYAARGLRGIQRFYEAAGGPAKGFPLLKRVLAAGPEEAGKILADAALRPVQGLQGVPDWLAFFFPAEAPPVYLFLDWRLMKTYYWWYWLGSWDPARRDGYHPKFREFYGIRLDGDVLTGGGGLRADLRKGEAAWSGGWRVRLSQAVVCDTRQARGLRYKDHPKGFSLEAFLPGGFGAVMDLPISVSVFNRLFVRHTYQSRYFRPVILNAPSHQLWEVIGEVYRPEAGKAAPAGR